MGKMKKIGVCMAAVAGAAGIAGLSAKAVEGVRKKWFLRGFEAGLLRSLTNFEPTGFKVPDNRTNNIRQ